jgi:hypothetical protein
MAIQFDFDNRPMMPGESRDFTLTSGAPARVDVRCFLSSPPPPGYRACSECGSYPIQQHQTIQIKANQAIFSQAQGGLDITISDANGDEVKIHLQVTMEDPDNVEIEVELAR